MFLGGKKAIIELTKNSKGTIDNDDLSKAFQDAYSPLLAAMPLRYKRKMIGFRPHGPNGVPPGHVAYCMMTFLIRNRLKVLQEDRGRYINAVRGQARSWKLDDAQAACLHQFAIKWAAWSAAHMGEIDKFGTRQYLDYAERFVDDLLAGPVGPASRNFYGTAVLVGFDDVFVQDVQERTGAVDVMEVPSKQKRDTRTLAEFGTLIKLNALSLVRPTGHAV
jgi:hypothetical protein